MTYEYKLEKCGRSNRLKVYVYDDNIKVGHALLSETDGTWTISGWYIEELYQNQGIGKRLLGNSLKYLYTKLGRPTKIEYIWNGYNEYVMDWLSKNFSPLSRCPIAVQKYQSDDDWDSHIYTLDAEKVLAYFKLG